MGRGVAAAVLASFLLAGQQPSRQLTPAEATQAILEAEDRRIALPLDIRTPVLDTLRQRQEFDLRLLVELARGGTPAVQRRAFLALGRYERRELTPEILQSLYVGPAREVAFALAQSMRGPALAGDQQGIQLRGVFEALLTVSRMDPRKAAPYIAPAVRSVGRLPYESADQVQAAHAFLLQMMERVDPDPDLRPILADIADAIETLTRQHRRFSVAATETIGWLKRIAEARRRTYGPDIRLAAMRALVTAREVDTETIRAVVGNSDPRMRRLATLSLAGGGSDIADTERSGYLGDLLQDAAPIVRIEALRAWARHETAIHGCQRLTEAAAHDRDMNVRIVAIGLLADACPGDADVTQALTSLTRAPKPPQWHAEAHALVALARRAPARAEVPMRLFVKESSWQLRMYTARAAGILNDPPVLERLAYDPHHNVREATLAHLKRLKGQEAEPFFADALRQADYQLLRTAARELGDLAPTPALTTLLASALTRVTAERRETSRDTRLALLARLAAFDVQGTQIGTLVPLLKDYDIEVARAAATVLAEWTGSPQEIAPELLPRPAPVLVSAVTLEVGIAGAGSFDIILNPDVAPLTSRRFLQLVSQGYYNGLTFHRVVPNFVIQGGSPGANEYAGDSIYTRDERSWVSHRRGTVGLSTRGRDTGDMQFFVNLVDNPRLDYEYTVFGHVPPAGMAVVDRIAEGAEMSIRLKPDDRQ